MAGGQLRIIFVYQGRVLAPLIALVVLGLCGA